MHDTQLPMPSISFCLCGVQCSNGAQHCAGNLQFMFTTVCFYLHRVGNCRLGAPAAGAQFTWLFEQGHSDALLPFVVQKRPSRGKQRSTAGS